MGKFDIHVMYDVQLMNWSNGKVNGTMVSVDLGSKVGFVDVVLPENVHGLVLTDIDGSHFIF